MQGGGFRAGGGHRHHHHHHHAGRALVAGAVIGAAAASASRNRQPDVVVVGTTPGAYATTTTYQHATYQQPATVVVAPPPQKKKKPMAGCIVCLFLVTIILCMSLIPWPGAYSRELVFGAQRLDSVSGHFVEHVSARGSEDVTLYALNERPSISKFRDYERSSLFSVSYGAFFSMQFTLLEGSSMQTKITYTQGCSLTYYILRGQAQYASFVNGGYFHYERKLSFGYNLDDTFYVDTSDEYYFIIYNPSCTSSYAGSVVFHAHAASYDVSRAFYTCNPGDCEIAVPYPQAVYFVLETPSSFLSQDLFRVDYHITGRWYTYTCLYVGLFLGMILCSTMAAAAAHKRQKESDEESARLIAPGPTGFDAGTPSHYPVAQAEYVSQATYSSQPPYPTAAAPYQGAPYPDHSVQAPYPEGSNAPPPYAPQ